jgi:hypothetical protein
MHWLHFVKKLFMQVADAIQSKEAFLNTGSMPAQLLFGMLQQMGGTRQEDLPYMPPCIPGKVCGQSSHQHSAGLGHSYGQAGRAPSYD